MYKTKVYILSYVSIVLPIFLSAAPIDKYYVPQQQQQIVQPQQQKPSYTQDIYTNFRNKISGLSPEEREKLKSSFQNKMDNASKNKNFDEAAYYQSLIKILNEF